MNYEFNMLDHVGVVDKSRNTEAETVAHEEDDNTPTGPMDRWGKIHPNHGNGCILQYINLV